MFEIFSCTFWFVGIIHVDFYSVFVFSPVSSSNSNSGVVRTLKAEKRQQGQLSSPEGDNASADPREVEAEKRAAWRKARCVSEDVFEKFVITPMCSR